MCTANVNPALTRLSGDTKLLARIMADRPALLATALLNGATAAQAAAVLGRELDELRMAAGRWAPKLRKAGQLTEGECATVLAIVSEPTNQ
jgi:hypothetical protein